MSPRPDSVQIDLDPQDAERNKIRRRYRLNVIEYPLARLIGNALLILGVFLHNVFIPDVFSPDTFAVFAIGLVLYSLISWGLLYLFWEKLTRFDLGVGFMVLDIVAWTFAIYVSGGERSWLFFLMMMRAADQRLAGPRRVLGFGAVSMASYAGLILYLALVEHSEVLGPTEVAKFTILAAANLYLGAAARTAETYREKLLAAIRLAREALVNRRESEERYRTLFEAVADPIMMSSLDGTIVGVNQALEAATGYRRDELIGRHFGMLTTVAIASVSQERLLRAIAGEILPPAEVLGRHKDGELVAYAVRTTLIRDDSGQPVGIVSIYRDIRDRKRYEEELDKARDAAERANRAKSQFLANMSHELRTPLNSVIGFSRVLLGRRDGDLTERQETFIRSMHQSSTYLLHLISSVLDLARVESGKLEVALEEVNLAGLVEECLGASQPLTGGKPVALEADIPRELPPLRADRVKLKQVLLNLLSNAIKFTPAGQVVVSARVRAESFQISVADTGVGISASEISRLFEPFYRPDGLISREIGGTGLGLAISKSFVELHGGSIWVESRERQGSTFHFTIPLAL